MGCNGGGGGGGGGGDVCVCMCVVMLYEKQSSRGVLHVVWRTIRQLKYAAAVNQLLSLSSSLLTSHSEFSSPLFTQFILQVINPGFFMATFKQYTFFLNPDFLNTLACFNIVPNNFLQHQIIFYKRMRSLSFSSLFSGYTICITLQFVPIYLFILAVKGKIKRISGSWEAKYKEMRGII